MQPDAVNRAQPDRAGDDVAHFGKLVLQRIELENDLLARLVKKLAFARQAEALVAALDQRHAETFLHRANLLADRRLRNEVERRRLAEAARLHQIAKYFEGFNLHRAKYKHI